MEFLIPLPDHQYYLWQMLVQVAHFRELGYEQDAHYLVVYFDQPSQTLRRLFESDELRCYIHAYPDTRADRGYSASMKPWLLGQYFDQFPEQVSKVHNYLDPDVMFTHPMDFTPFEQHDGRWYGSDTRSYTGAQYIREKGEQLFLDLCAIADSRLRPSLSTTITPSAPSISSRMPAPTSGSTSSGTPSRPTTT